MEKDIVTDIIKFIKENKGRKFHNSDIDQKFYDKLLERKQNHKRTNVKAIKSVYKLIQYNIAEIMISGSTYTAVNEYLNDLLDYNLANDFMLMFTEIEEETPTTRWLKNPRIERIGNDFFVYDNENKIKIDNVEPQAMYYLIPNIEINLNCWENFENCRKVPINSISAEEPVKIDGIVTFDKQNNTYSLSNIIVMHEYPISGIYIVARYSGLRRSAWISSSSLNGKSENLCEACQWPGDQNIVKGRIYLVNSSYQTIASIKSDWNGFYNNISFDKLKTLLDKLL